jgi:hypothetical protein
MANVKFTDYNIGSNGVTLYFVHEGFMFDTDHDETISIGEARQIIAMMSDKIKKYSKFSLDYSGHSIEINAKLAAKCIAEFKAKHGE